MAHWLPIVSATEPFYSSTNCIRLAIRNLKTRNFISFLPSTIGRTYRRWVLSWDKFKMSFCVIWKPQFDNFDGFQWQTTIVARLTAYALVSLLAVISANGKMKAMQNRYGRTIVHCSLYTMWCGYHMANRLWHQQTQWKKRKKNK